MLLYVTAWYAQLMALFSCTMGNFAIVRWCTVVQYAASIKDNSSIKRTKLTFEIEKFKRRGVEIKRIKYDVIPLHFLILKKGQADEYERRPPYIYPDFSCDMKLPLSNNLMSYNMVDAAFFT